MCGIAGYIGKKIINERVINNTLDLMKNRGPDHQNSFSCSYNKVNIYLLHSRLSIIDIDERSNQPYHYNNCTLVFNGEIYNYIEVREDLKKLGYIFDTNSDTEVLIKAYIEYGMNCVKYFNGMWSFAIWDDTKKKIFLSRDRFAEKPLFYFKDNDGFYFASEIKAIQSLLQKKLEINYDHLKRYLVYGYKFLYKTPEEYFHGIYQIEFASNVTLDCDINFTQLKYWKPESNIKKMTLDDAVEESKYHLLESVKLRLRSDVPLAFCLSGGVDSASLASIAKKEFNYDITTFSIIDSDKRYNELDNVHATIDDLDCKHFLIHLGFENMIQRLEDLICYHDSPISTISYLVHSMLSEQINKHGYRVSVSGTSADELFTGYYDHFNLYLYEMRNHPKFDLFLNEWKEHTGNFIRNPYLKNPKLYFEDPSIRIHNHLNSHIFASFLIDDYSIDFNEHRYTNSLLRNRMLNELFNESIPVILHEDDLNSMRYSIENRSPFLDVNLFEFVYSIPIEYLIHDGYGKFVLRKAVDGILNDQVRLDRRKKGFNASINSILNFKKQSTIEYILSESPVFEIVRKEKIQELLKIDHFENSYQKFMFNFLNTKIFLEKFSS